MLEIKICIREIERKLYWKLSVMSSAKFKSDVYFSLPLMENLYNQEKHIFPDY